MSEVAKRRHEDWERSLASWKAKQGNNMHKSIMHESDRHVHLPNEGKNTLLTRILIFLAFAIPIAILGYALYINYLPFGYSKSYQLTINDDGTISPLSNQIYLANSKGRKLLSLPDGVQGQINVILDPKVALKDASIDISIDGDNIFLGTMLTNYLDKINWDYNWDFTNDIPITFESNLNYDSNEKCAYFNTYKENILKLPNSQDLFESGPMTIYVRWKPSQISTLIGDNQQIIGHYNWELWQSAKTVQFRVGRMNNDTGGFYGASYSVDSDFFGKEHEALAIYSPDFNGNGYIELWIDGNLAERVPIGSEEIYRDYNSDKPLSFGWSSHNYGKNPYFDGCLYNARISSGALVKEVKQDSITGVKGSSTIPIIGNGKLRSVSISVRQ